MSTVAPMQLANQTQFCINYRVGINRNRETQVFEAVTNAEVVMTIAVKTTSLVEKTTLTEIIIIMQINKRI